jgi:hypothetical protein
MDFNEAYYGRKIASTHPRSPRSTVYKAASITPIWPEYRGHSSQRRYTYSPTLAKATHQHAMHVFQQAEYVLSKAQPLKQQAFIVTPSTTGGLLPISQQPTWQRQKNAGEISYVAN